MKSEMHSKYTCIGLVLFLLLVQQGCSHTNTGFFWHITDMHWDPTYDSEDPALSCSLATTAQTFGMFGDFRCDPPWQLINSSMHAMRQIKADVDFLIWTGDDTPHIWNDTILNKQVVTEIIWRESDILQTVFSDKIVYSALGNHDWSPKDQLPPKPDSFYDLIAGKWEPWMDESANETFTKAAYYTMLQSTGLRMIVLNTNLYYTSNLLTAAMPDPGNQLQWLDDVMTQAQLANEKVVIVAHVPPGMFEKHANKSWYYPYYNRVFLALLIKHSSVISGIHMAHHHTDSFRLIYNDKGEAVATIFLGPALTPWETTLPGTMGGPGNNPSVRLVEYDRATGQAVDIHQYYLNLTAANSLQDDVWALEYRATEYFDIPDLSPASLHQLVQRMEADDEMFGRYYRANGVLYDPDEAWTEEIRTVHLCAIQHISYDKYAACMNPPTSGAGSSLYPLSVVLVLGVMTSLQQTAGCELTD